MSAKSIPRVILEDIGADVSVPVTVSTSSPLPVSASSPLPVSASSPLPVSVNDSITYLTAFAAPNTSGASDIVSATTGKRIVVVGYQMQSEGTVTAQFNDDTPTNLSLKWTWQAREGAVAPIGSRGFYFRTAVGKKLQLTLNDNVVVNVQVQYYLE